MASNYGSTFTFNGTTYPCYVVDFPEISTGKINTTNHGSSGRASNIPDGVVTVGEVTLSLPETAGLAATFNTAIVNKTTAATTLANGVTSFAGSAWIMSCKAEAADAQSPDDTKLTIVISCTGTWTVT